MNMSLLHDSQLLITVLGSHKLQVSTWYRLAIPCTPCTLLVDYLYLHRHSHTVLILLYTTLTTNTTLVMN